MMGVQRQRRWASKLPGCSGQIPPGVGLSILCRGSHCISLIFRALGNATVPETAADSQEIIVEWFNKYCLIVTQLAFEWYFIKAHSRTFPRLLLGACREVGRPSVSSQQGLESRFNHFLQSWERTGDKAQVTLVIAHWEKTGNIMCLGRIPSVRSLKKNSRSPLYCF